MDASQPLSAHLQGAEAGYRARVTGADAPFRAHRSGRAAQRPIGGAGRCRSDMMQAAVHVLPVLAPSSVTLLLCHPVTDGAGTRLELLRQLLRRPGPDQLHHLLAKLRRVRSMCPRHRCLLLPRHSPCVHESGATPPARQQPAHRLPDAVGTIQQFGGDGGLVSGHRHDRRCCRGHTLRQHHPWHNRDHGGGACILHLVAHPEYAGGAEPACGPLAPPSAPRGHVPRWECRDWIPGEEMCPEHQYRDHRGCRVSNQEVEQVATTQQCSSASIGRLNSIRSA